MDLGECLPTRGDLTLSVSVRGSFTSLFGDRWSPLARNHATQDVKAGCHLVPDPSQPSKRALCNQLQMPHRKQVSSTLKIRQLDLLSRRHGMGLRG